MGTAAIRKGCRRHSVCATVAGMSIR